MKITFLGTSHGYAELNRYTSATLIETDDFSYLLDAGAPVEWLMVNNEKDFDKIRGIFITHMHNDHVANLSTVIEPMLRFRYNDKAACFFPGEEGKNSFLRWMEAMGSAPEDVKKTVKLGVTREGRVFDNGDISVSAKHNLHLGENGASYSYIFEKDGKKVLFTGDMGGGFTEYPEIAGNEHYSLVVCEMAHSRFSDVCEMLKNTNTERMIITHYYDPMIEDAEKLMKAFPFPAELAEDGMTVII